MTLFAGPSVNRWVRVPDPVESPFSLPVLGDPALAFIVHGSPAPQGSKAFKGMRINKDTGKKTPILVEQTAARTNQWRDDVVRAATDAMPVGWQRLAMSNRDGLVVDMVFTRERPAGLRRRHVDWPATAPDLDKLARSTGDALTTSGAIRDDARIVAYRRLAKVWVNDPDPDALPHPGAVIRIWSLRGSAFDTIGGLR